MPLFSPSCRTYDVVSRVIFLALCLALGGCAYLERHYVDPCKTRAYVGNYVTDYINARFPLKSPVRMAVLPYSVPANLAGSGMELPGLGNEMGWKVQSEILASGDIPIVELFNRQDWPGKKEEFFTGNFGALAFAREAGYDLVMVGLVEAPRATDYMTSYNKVLDVESGVTVFYSKSTVTTIRPELAEARDSLWLGDYKPSTMYTQHLSDQLARCIVHGMRHPDE